MVWGIAGILLLLLVVSAVLSLVSVRLIRPIFERAPTFNPPSFPPDSRAQRLEIPTTRGATLSACLYHRSETESRGLIIFCPEYGATKWSCQNYCEGLWDAGFDLLAFDFRNSGDSSCLEDYRDLHWVTDYEMQDVRAVIDYVRSRPDLCERPIGLFGVSRGGGAALAAGAMSPEVELIATDSAFATEPMMRYYIKRWYSLYVPDFLFRAVPAWHIRMSMRLVKWCTQRTHGCRYAELIPRLRQIDPRKRVFMISGSNDSFVRPEIAREIAGAAGSALHELWLVPHAKHNSARHINPDEYDNRLCDFFAAMSPVHEREPQAIEQSAS